MEVVRLLDVIFIIFVILSAVDYLKK